MRTYVNCLSPPPGGGGLIKISGLINRGLIREGGYIERGLFQILHHRFHLKIVFVHTYEKTLC